MGRSCFLFLSVNSVVKSEEKGDIQLSRVRAFQAKENDSKEIISGSRQPRVSWGLIVKLSEEQ